MVTELQGTIKGMDCASCVAKITKNIENMDGVSDVTVNLVTTKISVSYDKNKLSDQEIKRSIKRMGYTYQETLSHRSFFNLKENKELSFALVGALFLVIGIVFDVLVIPHLHPLFLAIAIGVGGIPIYIKAFAAVKAFTIDIDLLMVLAIIGASIIGQWEEAAEIVVLFSFAELLEAFAMDRTRNSIRELMDLAPDTANKLDSNDVQTIVPVEELIVGDRIIVKPGGKIPIDGKIEWGNSYVDQSVITGESKPIDKIVGNIVYAGSINGQGSLIIRVTSMPSESTLSRIIQMVENAETKKAKTEQFIQKFAKYYTPIMVFIAFLVTFVPVVIFGLSFNQWFYRSLVVLIVSCPCALVLSTPITVVTAITRASRNGVLIKGGKYLEELSKVKAVAVDKTGTLTSGKIRVYKRSPRNSRIVLPKT